MKTMSTAIKVFMEMQGIDLLGGDVWGHRKDLDEYYTVEDATIEEIRTLTANGATADDVANQIQAKAKIGVGFDQVHCQIQDNRLDQNP